MWENLIWLNVVCFHLLTIALTRAGVFQFVDFQNHKTGRLGVQGDYIFVNFGCQIIIGSFLQNLRLEMFLG